jgi:hypothetical protein
VSFRVKERVVLEMAAESPVALTERIEAPGSSAATVRCGAIAMVVRRAVARLM